MVAMEAPLLVETHRTQGGTDGARAGSENRTCKRTWACWKTRSEKSGAKGARICMILGGYALDHLLADCGDERTYSFPLRMAKVQLCMKHEIPLMLGARGGAIVNTSSGGSGFLRGAAYVAAKHGVIGLTRAAALDYAQANIRVNAVCPGIIDTQMMDRVTGDTPEGRQRVISQEPIGRMGTPEEIAAAVVAVFGGGFLRRRARDGRRWRPNGVVLFVANRDAVRGSTENFPKAKIAYGASRQFAK